MSQDNRLDNLEHEQDHFMRAIQTPLELLSEMEDKARIKAILRHLDSADQELLREHFAAETMEMLNETEHRMIGVLEKVVTFCCFPLCWTKIWGVIYALDMSLHQGRNMSEKAKQLGASRAAISIHAREFLELIGVRIATSRWLRSDETAVNNQTATKTKLKQRP